MGDQFNLSGDFRGAILNIRSTLLTLFRLFLKPTDPSIPKFASQPKILV